MSTGFKLADPREYRRGVILGLTLAEMLILLVFLLLLSCSALLVRRDHEVDDLVAKLAGYETKMAPVMQALRERGLRAADLDDLAARLERVAHQEATERVLNEAQSALAAARAAASESAHETDELRARIARLEDESHTMAAKAADADAMLRILDQASLRGGSGADRLKTALDRTARQAAADQELTGQNAQMRNELARLKGNGGSGLPYCWTTPDGRPVYMLRVELQDDGVVVNDIDPRPRPDDKAWPMLDAVPRGEQMPVGTLISDAAALQAEANAAKCRYAVMVVDGTGRTNKPGYKVLMGRLWTIFMLHEVPR